MATFHDLKHIVKDTIAVDAKQRYTPQEVKFINRNNEFYGTFHGRVDATKLLVSNAELSGCTFFDENGVSVDVSKLGKTQEEIKELIESLNGELYELSAKTPEWIKTAVSESSGSVLEDVTSTIGSISTILSNDIDGLASTVTEISNGLNDRVTQNENDIKDIQEKQIGAISYRGVMRVLNEDTSFHDIFIRNFDDSASTREELDEKTLEQGWMWCIQTDDHKKHYPIEGEFLEHGDFIVINQKVTVKDVNKKYVDILDMMDFDLSCDTKLDFESPNPVQNKVIANEIESLKQIMTGIDASVSYVDGVLSSLPNTEGFTKNQVVRIESTNGIQTDYILCENDDGEKYWKQYVVDGIFERKEFKNHYSDSEANAVEQLSDSNENYPSSRLVKKIYEDLAKSDKELKEALDAEIGDRKEYADNISAELSKKIAETKTELEDADSAIHSELTSLINQEKNGRIASLETAYEKMHRLYGYTLTAINDVYEELTSNYSQLTSSIELEKNERRNADIAILTSLNGYMEKETRERNEQDEALKTGFETKINEETQARTTKDESLQESIESLEDLIRKEAEDRESVDSFLDKKINKKTKENADAIDSGLNQLNNMIIDYRNKSLTADNEILSKLNDVNSDLLEYKITVDTALLDETTERKYADNALCTKIDEEINNRKTDVHTLSTELTSYISENNDRVKTIKDNFETYKNTNDDRVINVKDYAESLCATTKTEVDNIKQTLVSSVKYMGHITLKQSDSALSIWQIFENYLSNKLTSMTTLSNGWMYTVTFDESMPSSVVELSTSDKVVLTPKDYIIIDNHDPDSGGVDISAISRETIDIIDVVDDVYVKRSEYEKAKKDLSDYVDSKTNEVYSDTKTDNETLYTKLTEQIDAKINALDYVKVELTGSKVLSEISQTDGKISVETRKLSIDELENADSFVDNKINNLDVENKISNARKQLITELKQDDGKISYETTDLVISSIPDLQPQLTNLSAADATNAKTIQQVGGIVDGMYNTLSTLYSDISACFYFDDNGLKHQKTIDEIDFDDTIKVCFQLMKKLDGMFNPMGSINMYESYDKALPAMDKKFY